VIGVGFTATKRLGTAVVRNRARRRLREAARLVFPELGRPGFDYVLVARPPALACDFQALKAGLRDAVARVTDRAAQSRARA
jgi:ribonuclease P protein component